ncbi:VIT1/CCC1 family predicted Fe2+/Mn2+ transporter [Lachnospiraceae bacterium PM6-15]|uniref:VIT1/CCC1 transporter family protein n=1 Tax=Ohessyouella blattaphilus TaxID=2949333 RepID=UPI003E25EB9E
MKRSELSAELLAAVYKSQVDEVEGAIIYDFLAKREKNPENKKVLKTMGEEETKHAKTWKEITGEDVKPRGFFIFFMKLLSYIFGFTFVLKQMAKSEEKGAASYNELAQKIPLAARMAEEEEQHEEELFKMLDEERLHYVGSMVLGLNDALVELTGAIAGVTFALANTKMVAMTGIITGISATLSMAASNYLAERADGNKDALKSSLYTGIAYLVTVALLVLPYLLLPAHLYAVAFVIMLATVILIILFFNYYLSVVKDEPFLRRFGEMAIISMSVALLSFVIGILAKNLLGIDA